MTEAERVFWLRAHRRVADLQPDVASALLRAYQILRDSIPDVLLLRLIASGAVDQLVAQIFAEAVLDRAFLPLRQRIRDTTQRSFRYAVPELPKAGKVNGTVAVAFDHLSHVIRAVRTLDDRAILALKAEVRDVVRAYIENGLRDGQAPAVIARGLRGIIGLAPNQLDAVLNFERALRGEPGARSALDYALRDKRFDAVLKRVKAGELTDAQVARMTDAYRRKMLGFHAETVARTTTLDSYKIGQRLAWQNAARVGVIPDGFVLMRQWIHFDPQPDPRLEHIAMSKLAPVPADQPYVNGDNYAGESDPWNCKCVDRYILVRAA